MKTKKALQLIQESLPLMRWLDRFDTYDYYVWLSFVEEYKDVNFSIHKIKLDKMLARNRT